MAGILTKHLSTIFRILIVLLITHPSANAQSKYHFTTYTQDDGLVSGTLRGITKDSTGFLWLFSENGLSRFDGYSFKTFRHSNNNPNSISSSDVKSMVIGKSGKILFRTASGICSYNPNTESFKTLISYQQDNEILNLFANNNGFWVVMSEALIHINPSDDKITKFAIPLVIPMLMLKNQSELLGDIWLSKENFVLNFNLQTKTFFKILVDTAIHSSIAENSLPNQFFKGPDDEVYHYSLNGFFKYDKKQQTFLRIKKTFSSTDILTSFLRMKKSGDYIIEAFNYDPISITNIATNATKTIRLNRNISNQNERIAINGIFTVSGEGFWITTSNHGTYRFTNNGILTEHITTKSNLPSNNISLLFEDKNVLWLTSPEIGLIKVESYKTRFASYQPHKKNMLQTSQSYKNIRAIIELDKNNLLIGSLEGLVIFNKNTNTIESANHPFSYKSFLETSPISCIYQGKDSTIWISSWTNKGIYIFNNKNKRLTNISPITSGKNQEYTFARCTYLDSQGFLWLGVNANILYRINTKTIDYLNTSNNSFEKFAGKTTTSDTLLFANTFVISENNKKEILIGTQNGFYKYSYITNKFKRFVNQPGNPKSISDDNIRSFCVDKKGTTWIGTNGGGLNRFDEATQTFKAYTVDNGFPDNSVYSILADDNGNLWMGTNRGICRFTIATESCTNYALKDGLQNYEFNTNAACKLTTGEMVFGGINGFNIFHPDSLVMETEIPEIVITQFKVGDVEKAISNETILLNHDENYLSFQFAALNFFRNSENKYAYKMEGLDKDWVYCGERRYTNYANLSPGHYIFHVKAANYYGEWNKDDVELKLYISAPWYNTWLFKILVLLFLSSVVYTVFRFRLKQKLKLQEVRNRIASDLHDEIGSTLSSVFIYSEVAQNTNNENKISESNQYLKYISSDVAKMIDALSDIVWTVNSKNDRFENIINRMRASAIELFDAKGYELHLDFDESMNSLKLGMAERKNFYLFYKEAINNVVKYADGRNVSISLLLSNSKIKLSIQDDGKGFDVIRKSEGNGLNNMRKRAADLKGKFEIHSSANKGTTVHLVFPYS